MSVANDNADRPSELITGTHEVKASKVTKDKPKRSLITAACEECRLKKAKCCGGRPSCTRCLRAKKACVYSVNPGETRQAAARGKTESLQREYDSLLNILDCLRSRPLSDARSLFDSLRASEDASAFLKAFSDIKTLDAARTTVPSSNDSSADSRNMLSASQSPDRSSDLSSLYSLDMPPSTKQPCKEPNVFTDPSLVCLSLPPEPITRKAVDRFYSGSGKLFHVIDRKSITSHLDSLYRGNQRDVSSILCEVCSVAAIGSLYLSEPCEAQGFFYDTARVLLDDTIQEAPLQAAKCCTLLSMYNVMSKATVALAYVELGVDLCRRHQALAGTTSRPPRLPRDEWVDMRRTWRTLLFLGSWVSSTLGYITSNDWMLPGTTLKDIELEDETHVSDVVQTEMVKIATLKQAILRMDITSNQPSDHSVGTIREGLHKWHQDLPEVMRLTNLLQNPEVTRDVRVTIYNVHLLYLGALMLIYRQVLNHPQHTEKGRANSLSRAHEDAVVAAQQSSRILNLLRQDDGIFQRCWLTIFQAYCASVLILHGIAQELTHHERGVSRFLEDLEQAQRCIDILKYCGETDTVAAKFYCQLQPYHDTLSSISTSPRSNGTANPSLQLQSVCAELFSLVRRPFGQNRDLTNATSFDGREIDPVHPSTTVRPLESCGPASFDWQAADISKRDGTISTLLKSLKPVRFLDGFTPHGWTDHTNVHTVHIKQQSEGREFG